MKMLSGSVASAVLLLVLVFSPGALAQTEASSPGTGLQAQASQAAAGVVAGPQFGQDFGFQQFILPPQMPKEAPLQEMMLASMGNIVFQRFSYSELQAMCPDEEEIVTTVYDYLEGQGALSNICSGIEYGLGKCNESKSFCENIGAPLEGEVQTEEQKIMRTCPPDEAKLAQLCVDRATKQQEEQASYVKDEIPIKCELEWERNQYHYQARCNEGQQYQPGYGPPQQASAYGQAGPGMGPGGQQPQVCPMVSPPSSETFKQCADQGGRLEGKRDDKGCTTGFECIQGQGMGTGTGECRSPPQEELERQKSDCIAQNGTPQPNMVGSCLVGYNCQAQPPTGEQPPTTCAQVITYALDPTTNTCTSFPTPCDVPQGWQTGCTPTNTQTSSGGDTNSTAGTSGQATTTLSFQDQGPSPFASGPQAPSFYNPQGPAATTWGQGQQYAQPMQPNQPMNQQGWNQPMGQTYAPGTGPNQPGMGMGPTMSPSQEDQIPREAFCDKEKFLSACGETGSKAFASAFQQTNVKRICELEAKLNAKQMARFCKQAQTGKEECVERTEQACSAVSSQLEKCKSYSTPEKIKEFIKSKVHEMCVAKSFSEQKSNYDQGLVGVANSLELSAGQLPTEYGQWLQGEKSRLVQVTEGVSEVQQEESKKDAIYQLTKLLGAQTQRELSEAKKIREQAKKLDQTITSLKALSEQLTDEAMQATLDAQIKQLEERKEALNSSAKTKEGGASGIFGFLAGLFGGQPQAGTGTEGTSAESGTAGEISEPPTPQ